MTTVEAFHLVPLVGAWNPVFPIVSRSRPPCCVMGPTFWDVIRPSAIQEKDWRPPQPQDPRGMCTHEECTASILPAFTAGTSTGKIRMLTLRWTGSLREGAQSPYGPVYGAWNIGPGRPAKAAISASDRARL